MKVLEETGEERCYGLECTFSASHGGCMHRLGFSTLSQREREGGFMTYHFRKDFTQLMVVGGRDIFFSVVAYASVNKFPTSSHLKRAPNSCSFHSFHQHHPLRELNRKPLKPQKDPGLEGFGFNVAGNRDGVKRQQLNSQLSDSYYLLVNHIDFLCTINESL